MPEDAGDITILLREWNKDRSLDTDLLFQLVYPHLRTTAGALFRRERSGHVVQPTGVVNELFLRLLKQRKLEFADRQHFYSFSARVMRRILVDFARKEKSAKRGGGLTVPLEDHLAWVDASPVELIDLDQALEQLQQIDRRKCEMVELRYLVGFTNEEIADLLHLSPATVDRDLRFARSWLHERLAQHPPEPAP